MEAVLRIEQPTTVVISLEMFSHVSSLFVQGTVSNVIWFLKWKEQKMEQPGVYT